MFQFSEFKLRAATEDDEHWLHDAIQADDDHRDKVTPDFFYSQRAGVHECLVIEDAEGEPVFAFRIERALRVHIQFRPIRNKEDKRRTAGALTEGFLWLRESAARAGFRELLFQSTVAPLVKFCSKRFGFIRSANELTCGITPPEPQSSQENSAHAEHQQV